MEKISEGNFSSLVLCDSDEIQPLQCVYVCVCVCLGVCGKRLVFYIFNPLEHGTSTIRQPHRLQKSRCFSNPEDLKITLKKKKASMIFTYQQST